MSSQGSVEIDAPSFVLPPVLDLVAVQGIVERLLSMRGRDLVLDASGVERIGTPGIQVLLSAAKTWTADGVKLSCINVSEMFSQNLATIGVPTDWLAAGG